MKRARKLVLISVGIVVVIVCVLGAITYQIMKITGIAPELFAGDENSQVISEDWVPYVLAEETGESPLEGFLFQRNIITSSVNSDKGSMSNEDKVIASISEKVPDYPFDQIPLFHPEMLISLSQDAALDDLSVNVMYYTSGSPEEALDFYRSVLSQYSDFDEGVTETDGSKSYSLSFGIEAEKDMDAGVMIMEMPEATGYKCAINVHAAIRGAAKEEEQTVENRPDEVPANYPEDLVPLYELNEIFSAEGDSEGYSIQFSSKGSFDDAVDFYRSKLNDKPGYNETDDEGELFIYCSALEWEINVRILDESGSANIEVYVNKQS